MNLDILSSRTTSAFAVSVGTSLALESIFTSESPSIDPDRVIPQKVDILDYQEFWINLSTLFRNAHGSLAKEDSDKVLPREMLQIMDDETDMINSIVSHQSNNRVKVIYYACKYQEFESKYPRARIRKLNTDNQRSYAAILSKTLDEYLELNKNNPDVRIFRDKIKTDNRPKALMLSHIPYDLLSVKSFQTLHLIESHTGLLRTPSTWYTKYYDGKNLPPMPFNEGLLQVFGDKEIFSVMDLKLKRELIELAKTCRWTPATTRDKLRYDLDKLKNPYYTTILKEIV